VDFILKTLAYNYLAGGKIIVLIPGLLRLLYLKNTGAAFGIMHHSQWLLVLISLGVAIYILHYVNQEYPTNKVQYSGLMFIFSGAVGNLINRIFSGGVIDYIDLFGRWPVFNLADILINIGIVLLIISIVFDKYHHH
jgi:signal peptidase II